MTSVLRTLNRNFLTEKDRLCLLVDAETMLLWVKMTIYVNTGYSSSRNNLKNMNANIQSGARLLSAHSACTYYVLVIVHGDCFVLCGSHIYFKTNFDTEQNL